MKAGEANSAFRLRQRICWPEGCSERPGEQRQPHDAIRESRIALKLPRYRSACVVGGLLSVVLARSGLLVHDLDLLVDHLPVKRSIATCTQ